MEAQECVSTSDKNLGKNVSEIMCTRKECSKETDATKIKRPRKILTKKYLLDLETRRSPVTFGRAILLEQWRQKSDYSDLRS